MGGETKEKEIARIKTQKKDLSIGSVVASKKTIKVPDSALNKKLTQEQANAANMKRLVSALKKEHPSYRGGIGTQKDPFVLNLRAYSKSSTELGSTKIEYPLSIGSYNIKALLTLDQISNRNIQKTYDRILKSSNILIKRLTSGALIASADVEPIKVSRDNTFRALGLNKSLNYVRNN